MKKISLSLKISLAFVMVSMATLAFIYLTFYHLFEQQIYRLEKEKAELIFQTIEPIMAMHAYLGMTDEVKQLAQQTAQHPQVDGLVVTLNEVEVWRKLAPTDGDSIQIERAILEPLSSAKIGELKLSYSMASFRTATDEMRQRITYYLGGLAIVFLLFTLFIRYLLSPLQHIASKVRGYKLGDKLGFDGLRMEPETATIATAFNKMVDNVREYTLLLERYKQSVDESAIVARINTDGHITYVNDEFCRVSGYSRDELITIRCEDMRHPEAPEQPYQELRQAMAEKRIWKGTLKSHRKDGSAYYVRATVVPILDDKDNVIEFIAIQHDISQLIEQQEQIFRQTTDPDTQLPNRIKLDEDCQSLSAPKFAVVSLDNYRTLRDYYGEDTGRQALIEMAGLIQRFFAGHPVQIYKLAAGDFGVLASDIADAKHFHQLCRQLVMSIEDQPISIGDNTFDLRATAGVTQNPANLLTYASLALQYAQEKNRNAVLYEDTENLVQLYQNNRAWTGRIKQALKEDRFIVFVQPIVDAKTLQTNKYECLVRMRDVDGRIISPFHFLDIAKRSKLYHQITRRVVTVALETLAQLPDLEFSINLSPEDMMHQDTLTFIKQSLLRYPVASRLVLEIVESEGIENSTVITQFIAEMKALGCKIAIDDFGTGYSNFAYLMQLNVDYLKVDGSLIKNIDVDTNAQIISSTILEFCRQLNLSAVAEFVHNDAVMQRTLAMGFDYLQGYHLGEPVPIENLLSSDAHSAATPSKN